MAESGDDLILWRELMQDLAAGKVVEIPCASERVFARRAMQVVKRAEKSGLLVEVLRGEGGLRVERRGGALRTERSDGPRLDSREEKRRARSQRRDELRAERGADRSCDR